MNCTIVKRELHTIAFDLGADAFGVCLVEDLADRFHPEIREMARKLPFAISIGIALQKAVMETVIDRPSEIYKSHYRIINTQLDNITFQLAKKISEAGCRAIPIPASKVLTRYPMIGHLNHREIAHKAGLGWRGKNNLLINRLHGSRLRLATLLTDFEMEPNQTPEDACGTCQACIKKCPASAIGDTVDAFDLDKCREQVTTFCKENNFGQLICGLCLNSCPPKKKKAMVDGQIDEN